MTLGRALSILLVSLFYLSILHLSQCIQLGVEEEKLLRLLIESFEHDPEDQKYNTVITLPPSQAIRLPEVFIRQHKLKIRCPVHGGFLKTGKCTDILSRSSPRNPRNIYDIGGNVVLLQTFYDCSESLPNHIKQGRQYLSASPEVSGDADRYIYIYIPALPPRILSLFPFILQQRCGFSFILIDFLMTGIYQGQNFVEIAEGIATLNVRALARAKGLVERMEQPNDLEEDFCNNLLYAYPSSDKLMDKFLKYYDLHKEKCERHMSNIHGKCLTCDHTFRTNKHIGITREDGKFIRQFENVFLGLNEMGQVMIWRLTKSTASSEIVDLLKNLKQRLDNCGNALEMIIVDDCCRQKTFTNRFSRQSQ